MKYKGKKNGKHIIEKDGVYIALKQEQLGEMINLLSNILFPPETFEPEGFKPPDPSAYYQDIEDMRAPLKEIKNKRDLEGE